jgi:membrane protein
VKLFRFVKQVFAEFGQHKAGQMSAALAYTAVFAIGPFLLVVISVAGFIYGERAASGQLYSSLSNAVGPNIAKTLQGAIAHSHRGSGGIVALMIGTAGLLLAAVGLTNQLQSAFDTIFSVVPDPKGGIRRTIYVKLKNIVLLIVGSLAIAASLVLSAIISGLGHTAQQHIGLPAVGAELINEAASLCIFVLILFFTYKALPDVVIPKKLLLKTTFAVSILFLVGKIALGFIIGRNATAGAYGAAASLVVLLLWFYYTAQILLLGAEGLKVYADNHELIYKAKKFNLKRRSLNVDTNSEFVESLINAFSEGYRKSKSTKKKKHK